MSITLPRTSPGLPDPSTPDLPQASRRGLLAAAAGGIAAIVATAIGAARPSRVAAAPGDPLLAGSIVSAGATTTGVSSNSATEPTFHVTQNGDGAAIRGEADTGNGGRFTTAAKNKFGLIATNASASFGSGAAIQAGSTYAAAIRARSDFNLGLRIDAPNGQGIYCLSGNGVYSVASGFGTGVYGASTDGWGVGGQSTTGRGVYGLSSSGPGVRGFSLGAVGVSGRSYTNVAVHGLSDDQTGVSGQSSNWIGVFGMTSAANGEWAGYFQGDVNITGSTTSPAAVTQLDHPADPTNKTLALGAVLTDGLKVAYHGTATTDASGRANVRLPGYAAGVSEDLRYQLTVVGGRGSAWVERELDGARFVIGSDPAGVRVDWQVTGTRRDAWARAHPLAVEASKPDAERGTYLAPLEHGQPASRGRAYERLQVSIIAAED